MSLGTWWWHLAPVVFILCDGVPVDLRERASELEGDNRTSGGLTVVDSVVSVWWVVQEKG